MLPLVVVFLLALSYGDVLYEVGGDIDLTVAVTPGASCFAGALFIKFVCNILLFERNMKALSRPTATIQAIPIKRECFFIERVMWVRFLGIGVSFNRDKGAAFSDGYI